MTVGGRDGRLKPAPAAPRVRVGLFGLLGSGNIGNDASMEAILGYLRAAHPDAALDAMCMGSDQVRARYGIDTIPLLWYQKYDKRVTGVAASALKVLGKGADAIRTAAWVRRHDVVIVPGMGILEATLPLHAWGVPYSMFLLSASGRVFGTKVALISVGANVVNQRVTRWLFNKAARLAFYRSYRDEQSRDAMRRGMDTAGDPVYPDLVFSLPSAPATGDPQIVGVGLMAYYGSNDDRKRAGEIYATYIQNLESFIRWLLDHGRQVLLFYGDQIDEPAIRQVLADLSEYHSGPESPRLSAVHATSFAELSQAMSTVGALVGTRFHNVMCALKLGKPTISIGYAKKNVVMMEDMGLPEYWQYAQSLDVEKLIEQFTKLEGEADRVRAVLAARSAEKAEMLARQFTILDTLLFPARTDPAGTPASPSSHVG